MFKTVMISDTEHLRALTTSYQAPKQILLQERTFHNLTADHSRISALYKSIQIVFLPSARPEFHPRVLKRFCTARSSPSGSVGLTGTPGCCCWFSSGWSAAPRPGSTVWSYTAVQNQRGKWNAVTKTELGLLNPLKPLWRLLVELTVPWRRHWIQKVAQMQDYGQNYQTTCKWAIQVQVKFCSPPLLKKV